VVAKRLEAVQDNELITAAYTMSLPEKRLIMLAVAKLEPFSMAGIRDREPLVVTVTAKEWSEQYGGASGNAYRDMRRGARELGKRSVPLLNSEGELEHVYWLDRRADDKAAGAVTIAFGWTLSLRLRGDLVAWTPLLLKYAKGLQTFEAWRLYELCRQWRSTGTRIDKADDLRAMLDPEARYDRFADFNRRCLQPAMQEVNSKTDLRVGIEFTYKGRKITHVTFRIWAAKTRRQV